MEFDYFIPTKILFGPGKINQLYKEKMPGKKALLVISAGKSTRENGYLQKVEEQMQKAGVETFVFDKILSNPINGHVMEGAAFAREKKCDFVIGLGGGSSIDSAKAIAVMSTNEGELWDYISGGSGKGLPIKKDPLPIIAITTTAGTGTEADPWAVITKEETNEKIGFGYEKTFPLLSIVDPELMLTVPADLTAYQGFDALFHSTEGYINRTSNIMSDIYSLKAIELISKNLATAVHDGQNIEARECVALGNTLAGMVESTSGCISEHSIEHAMSAYHPKLPHGAGLIMISKAYYTNFVKNHACDEKFIEMARAMGKKNASNPMEFIETLVELQEACGVSELRMSDYGIKKEELPDIAKNARHTMGGLFEVDPLPISDETCLEILNQSYR